MPSLPYPVLCPIALFEEDELKMDSCFDHVLYGKIDLDGVPDETARNFTFSISFKNERIAKLIQDKKAKMSLILEAKTSLVRRAFELNPSIDSWYDEKAVTINSFNEFKSYVTRPDITSTVVNNVTVNETVVQVQPPVSQVGSSPTSYQAEKIYSGYAQGIGQYAGSIAATGAIRSITELGTPGISRALSDGYSLSSIRNWALQNNPVVDQFAIDYLGLPQYFRLK